MKRKGGHQSKPVREHVIYPKRTSLLLKYETIRWREDFPGHRLQAWSSPSKNVVSPRKHGTFWDKQDSKET